MIVKTMLNSRALTKPPTSKPLTMLEASIIIKALITKVKSPKVKTLIGNVRRTSNGLMITFKRPITITKIKALQNPAT